MYNYRSRQVQVLTCCVANSLVRAADAMALTQSEVGLVHRPDIGLC